MHGCVNSEMGDDCTAVCLSFSPHLCKQDALRLQWEAVGGGGCVKVVLETQV